MAIDLTQSIEKIWMETFSPTILEVRRDIDSFIDTYIFPSDDVEVVSKQLGRDYKVRKIIEMGLAGAVEYDDITGNTILSDFGTAAPSLAVGHPDTFTLYGDNAPMTFPGLNEMPSVGWIPIAFQLVQHKGDHAIPIDLLRTESLPAVIGKPIQASIRALARNLNLLLSNTFWKEGVDTSGTRTLNGIVSIAAFWNAGTPQAFAASDVVTTLGCWNNSATGAEYDEVVISRNAAGTLHYDESGQIGRIYNGMRLDLYWNNSGTATQINATDQAVYIDHINPLRGSFHLKIKVGSSVLLYGTPAPASNATIWLVPRKSAKSGSAGVTTDAYGLVDLIKASGTIGVDVETTGDKLNLLKVPELRSYVKNIGATGVAVALTEMELMKTISWCTSALQGIFSIDTFVGCPGAWLALIDTLDQPIITTDAAGTAQPGWTGGTTDYVPNGWRFNRNQGEPFDLHLGRRRIPRFVYDGRDYILETSRSCHEGTVWGLKTRDKNWKMYVPPRLRDAGTHELLRDAVEFLGPAMGYNSIFIPVNSPVSPVASPTNFRRMPFIFPHQFFPDQLPGVKLQYVQSATALGPSGMYT